MQFFYVLKYGVTWKVASKMIFGNYSYRSTLNRRFNKLVDDGIITDKYNEIVNQYISDHNIEELIIDSMDIVNGNCKREYVDKSQKLHKQAVRLTIMCTKDRVPLTYQTDPARQHDSKLGFDLANKFHINDGKDHYLVGDKGYQMNQTNKEKLLKENRLRLLVPKKRYNRKRDYKTRNYKCKVKRVRYSKQMKETLKTRIKVEHTNSILHRSFKRLGVVYDRSMKTFNRFIELAIICIIISKRTKE